MFRTEVWINNCNLSIIIIPKFKAISCLLLTIQRYRKGHRSLNYIWIWSLTSNISCIVNFCWDWFGTKRASCVITKISEIWTPYLNCSSSIFRTMSRFKSTNHRWIEIIILNSTWNILEITSKRNCKLNRLCFLGRRTRFTLKTNTCSLLIFFRFMFRLFWLSIWTLNISSRHNTIITSKSTFWLRKEFFKSWKRSTPNCYFCISFKRTMCRWNTSDFYFWCSIC